MAFTVSKPTAMWLLIFSVVAVVLVGIQIVRVNTRRPVDASAERRIYTTSGPLLPVQVEVAANSFFSHKIDLNRRMKLTGSFRTQDLKSNVSVLVVREADFENWKMGATVAPIVRTNSVPGGRLTPVLEPGVYHLIVDNRASDQAKTVATEFMME